MEIYCMAQETQTGALNQPKWVGWRGRWEGGSEGRGYMYTCGWLMLRFNRKQQNSLKQLSFNKNKQINKNRTNKKREKWSFTMICGCYMELSVKIEEIHTAPTYIIQFSSVAQSCPTLSGPINCSMPGLPVHHQLPEFNHTHIHRVSDAIQPSQPLSSPSPPAPNPSQLQGLSQRVNSFHEVAKVLEFQLQHPSFQWTPRTDLL